MDLFGDPEAATTDRDADGLDTVRAVALGGVSLLTLSYVSVFYYYIDVAGNPAAFVAVALGTLAAAVTLSKTLPVRRAVVLGAGLFAVGITLYLASLPRWPPIGPLVTDAVALLTGRSRLQVTNAALWVLGVSPAPLFLTWYFALRRWYVIATLVGGTALGFTVLTGDAWAPVVLLGVIGALVAVGVGDVDRRGDSLVAAEPLAVLLAAMILLSGLVSVVPAGPDRTYDPWSGLQPTGGGADTVEASLVNADSELGIQGDISLSPEVRFRVESSRSEYWQIGSYDRYTGDGWVRTGGSSPYSGRLGVPPGRTEPLTQNYEVLDRLTVLPSAWKPVSVSGAAAGGARVTNEGGLAFSGTLEAGDSFTVRSRVPDPSTEELRSAGTDYPEGVRERYTGVPSSTPDRVAERTARITANAENPYETAAVIERWLERNRDYSLDVERPEGNVADAFLFEMDAGYCTYFATTMATMLRTQGIPARLSVGYTSGERVSGDEWVVRGYDAHAWVEVYFPDQGWVRFDPTPASPREAAETRQLEQARENGTAGVDTDDTLGPEWTPTPTVTPAPLTPRPDANASGDIQSPAGTRPDPNLVGEDRRGISPSQVGANGTLNGTTSSPQGESGGDGGGPELPSREEASLGIIALLGLAVGLRRSGVTQRLYREAWLRYQPTVDPETDAERAFERLEYLLERRYRPRRANETPRQYVADIGADERARRVVLVRERARYGGDVSRAKADEAMALVDELVAA
jgi:transglutaminase-like putative cysteine protease